MSNRLDQKGFSLIELLLVVVIVGLLATVAIPSLLKSREAAERSSAIRLLKTMHTYQTSHMFHNGRFGRLDELNAISGDTLGTVSNGTLVRDNYTYFLFPSSASALRSRYIIIAIKFQNGRIVSGFIIDQEGVVETIFL